MRMAKSGLSTKNQIYMTKICKSKTNWLNQKNHKCSCLVTPLHFAAD